MGAPGQNVHWYGKMFSPRINIFPVCANKSTDWEQFQPCKLMVSSVGCATPIPLIIWFLLAISQLTYEESTQGACYPKGQCTSWFDLTADWL